MRVTLSAEYNRKKNGHRITFRLNVTDEECRATLIGDAVEHAIVLHGRANAELDATLRKFPTRPRTVVHCATEDVEGGILSTMLDLLRSAGTTSAAKSAPLEALRTPYRAALVKKYASLGLST